MTPAVQEVTLATLRRHTDRAGVAAARAFRDAAAGGVDLGLVIGGIADEAIECNDITILRPLVEALVMHHVRHGTPESLTQVLNSPHYRLYTSSSLEQMIGDGMDVEPAMALMRDGRVKGLDRRAILARYVRRYPKRLVREIERVQPALIPDLVTDLAMWEKVDVTPVLGSLTHLMDNDDARVRREVTRMYQMAEGYDADLATSAPALRKYLDDSDDEVRERLSNTLARYALRRGDNDEAFRILAEPDRLVRAGALRALSSILRAGKYTGDPQEACPA